MGGHCPLRQLAKLAARAVGWAHSLSECRCDAARAWHERGLCCMGAASITTCNATCTEEKKPSRTGVAVSNRSGLCPTGLGGLYGRNHLCPLAVG